MSAIQEARRLVEHQATHPVLSLFFDLDPDVFATPPARASQVTSLTDEAQREIERDESLSHDERMGLRETVQRVREYLLSDEPPFQGARALGIFCSVPDDLFEIVQIAHPVPGRVVIDRRPFVEPLVSAAGARRWCIALVNRRDARVFTGSPERLGERGHVQDSVHGQHDQGGWSQARYERSVEEDVARHLAHVAEELERLWRRERFDQLAVGGPAEVVAEFRKGLGQELSSRLVDERVEVDVETATDDELAAAISGIVERAEDRRERAAMDALAAGLGSGGRAAGGPEATLAALVERRVGTLLLEDGFERSGGRCPTCGLLSLEARGRCPADGSELEEVPTLREAVIEAALTQDAEVILARRYPDLGPHRGIAALLRF